jgi:alkyl sulfatase BDS1-like metallo-beta-lactamase superfamily hydrolase
MKITLHKTLALAVSMTLAVAPVAAQQITLHKTLALAVSMTLAVAPVAAQQGAPSKPATASTKAANEAVLKALPFNDKEDFANAARGFIGKPDTLTIKNAKGDVVWDLEAYKKYISADKPAPDSVNPSLWRNAQLNMQYGLFKVSEKIYQVRGYDITNITFIQGKTGWIVFDPLLSAETSKAAFELVTKHLGKKPIVAVVYSHSHVDHYGGVRGIID